MYVLHLDSSILGTQSASRSLGRELVERLSAGRSDASVHYRDLSLFAEPLADGRLLAARGTPEAQRDAAQTALVREADAVLDEFLAADVLVIGAPMYNFSIPSPLKNWIDLVAVAGKTFRYTEHGPVGLAGAKRAVLVATAGGQHAGTPSGAAHVDYLRLLLGFLGITDVSVVRAEGLGLGAAVRDPALQAARGQIAQLAGAAPATA